MLDNLQYVVPDLTSKMAKKFTGSVKVMMALIWPNISHGICCYQ